MEYQEITNLLDKEVGLSASNQPSKFRTRNWVEITDESRETCTSNYIKFETTMLRSNLCDYADAYILVNETITIWFKYNHLVDPIFQGVNRLFVLPFENENDRTSHSTYYLPKVEIKNYTVLWLMLWLRNASKITNSFFTSKSWQQFRQSIKWN